MRDGLKDILEVGHPVWWNLLNLAFGYVIHLFRYRNLAVERIPIWSSSSKCSMNTEKRTLMNSSSVLTTRAPIWKTRPSVSTYCAIPCQKRPLNLSFCPFSSTCSSSETIRTPSQLKPDIYIFFYIKDHQSHSFLFDWRLSYYKLIEECVAQIVLHKNGCDPDFSATKRFQIDVEPLIDVLSGKSSYL